MERKFELGKDAVDLGIQPPFSRNVYFVTLFPLFRIDGEHTLITKSKMQIDVYGPVVTVWTLPEKKDSHFQEDHITEQNDVGLEPKVMLDPATYFWIVSEIHKY
ncbi:uncharacterized protein LOC135152439 [Daucus carota subsp. sativus]|uniref:uncharacterized protein LOC135152439 n=1 Tax=Daucus carota subsp. sativus TaxID=79200 RepID=UPI0030827799